MGRGGTRKGAGRPAGTGKHGELTKTVRVPLSLEGDIRELVESKGYRVPVYSGRIAAGAPVAFESQIEDHVNIFKMLLPDVEHIGVAYASGDSMIDIGMFDGDMLIFSRKEKPKHGSIVIALVEGGQTVKRLSLKNSTIELLPENMRYKPIPLEGVDHEIQGVVLWWQRSA